jgi:hypothetical protein
MSSFMLNITAHLKLACLEYKNALTETFKDGKFPVKSLFHHLTVHQFHVTGRVIDLHQTSFNAY